VKVEKVFSSFDAHRESWKRLYCASKLSEKVKWFGVRGQGLRAKRAPCWLNSVGCEVSVRIESRLR
jgi:hypothetical protein